MNKLFTVATAVAFALFTFSANAQLADKIVSGGDIVVPAYISNALKSDQRPDEEKARDANRQPGKVMAFFDVKPGDKTAELLTFGGYYAGVLSGIVGETGVVYGQNNDWIMKRQDDGKSPIEKRIAEQGLTNVVDLVSELEKPNLPKGEMDSVFIVLIYHDAMGGFNTDRTAMNKAVFDSLKPGGIYGIIDHHAAPGMGLLDLTKNHRTERHLVVEEIMQAGFELAGETDVLENLDDPLNVSVFAPPLRGKTHRFVLKFRKPS
ncbi:MAG: class I SAM-dependent methyltransferase [Rhodospirillaceae bacterium]|nr:class I SAM-dependent methyltransferase [Rhodospirillaceae bacterium]MBT5240708.1 class I SAM-dependent methyltransferase [Rhodospirillaceae bacterium]